MWLENSKAKHLVQLQNLLFFSLVHMSISLWARGLNHLDLKIPSKWEIVQVYELSCQNMLAKGDEIILYEVSFPLIFLHVFEGVQKLKWLTHLCNSFNKRVQWFSHWNQTQGCFLTPDRLLQNLVIYKLGEACAWPPQMEWREWAMEVCGSVRVTMGEVKVMFRETITSQR